MDNVSAIEMSGINRNTIVHMTTCTERKKLNPSLFSIFLYLFCYALQCGLHFLPGGKADNCLPISTLAMVTICFCVIASFKRVVEWLAKGLFHPLWQNLGKHHRGKIVMVLRDTIARVVNISIFWWYLNSQEQSLIKGTVKVDKENCPQQAVAFVIGIINFYAMMIHDLFTNKMNTAYIVHHVAVILLTLAFDQPFMEDHKSSDYYLNTLAWLILGAQIMAVGAPGFVYYHLYPDSPIGQLASFLWITVAKTINVSVCFLVMPSYVMLSKFDKISDVTLWITFSLVLFNVLGEFYVLWISWKICQKKYLVWKNRMPVKIFRMNEASF